MISLALLTPLEEERYQTWRKNHTCLSTIEFIIKPDQVSQGVHVRCHKCKEEVDITDYDAA